MGAMRTCALQRLFFHFAFMLLFFFNAFSIFLIFLDYSFDLILCCFVSFVSFWLLLEMFISFMILKFLFILITFLYCLVTVGDVYFFYAFEGFVWCRIALFKMFVFVLLSWLSFWRCFLTFCAFLLFYVAWLLLQMFISFK